MTPDELKKWREKHHLSQPALAELLGVHKMTVWSWEHGRQEIPGFLHLALAELSRRIPAKLRKSP